MISSMLVFARISLGTLLREATRETGVSEHAAFACWGGDVPRSQGRDVLSVEAPARNFVPGTAAARMLRGKFVVGNPDPKGVRRGERSRTSMCRRIGVPGT